MNRNHKSQYKLVTIVLLALIVFTPGFYRNQWLAAGKNWFYDWRTIQEHMVIARLVQSRDSGVFSYGALLGFGNITAGDTAWNMTAEYQAYEQNGKLLSYFAYTSNPGLQGVFFGLFDQFTDLSPKLNLRLFHRAISLLTAFVLGLFVYWVIGELGWSAGLFTILFIAFSEWMTLFGGNIYWNLWAFYLPLVGSSFYLMSTSISETYNESILIVILGITMLIKCLFTGFEYITTALIMPLIPFIFYAIRDSWGWLKFLIRLSKAFMGLLAGAGTSLLILIWQIMQIKDGYPEAMIIILDALGKRTFGDPTKYVSEAESLNANLSFVLINYVNGRAILLRQILDVRGFPEEISYLVLFIIFLSFTLLLVILRSNFNSTTQHIIYALIAATWASAIAPLSWFILFKAHSAIHIQINFIIWQMPFTLYGIALCGYAIGLLIRLLPFKKILLATARR